MKANYTYLSDGTKAKALNASSAGYDYAGSFTYSHASNGSKALESVAFSGGRIRKSGSTYAVDYHITDHLGSVRAIVNASGTVVEQNDYYPFGKRHPNGLTQLAANRWRFSGKEEQDAAFGIAYSDFGARFYDRSAAWTAVDPMAEKYYSISPYVYCIGNPARFVDPEGTSTRVKQLEDGTYKVVGVDFNDDYNIYIFKLNDAGEWISTGVSIGMTPSIYSFVQDDNITPAYGAIIDPSNDAGLDFIQDLTENLRPLAYYMYHARNSHRFDFKVTNGTNSFISDDILYLYRGMPIYSSSDGIQFFGSARDVGNLVAGYYAAAYGMTWDEAREAFDSYNGSQEPLVSKYGQKFGFNLGCSLPEEERRLRRNLNFLIPASLPAYQSIKKKH